MPSLGIAELWHSHDANEWAKALHSYWEKIRPKSIALEKEMESLTPERFRTLSDEEWRQFIATNYFNWKHTNGLYRGNVCRHFSRNTIEQLARVKMELFRMNLSDTKRAITLIESLHGFGPSGASGLLAVMFPTEFGTADKFLVAALRNVSGLPEANIVRQMKPESLDIDDVTMLVTILRKKAVQNNERFSTNTWTPRKVDKVCWRLGH